MGADTSKLVKTMGDLAVLGVTTGIAIRTIDWSMEPLRRKSRSKDLFSL